MVNVVTCRAADQRRIEKVLVRDLRLYIDKLTFASGVAGRDTCGTSQRRWAGVAMPMSESHVCNGRLYSLATRWSTGRRVFCRRACGSVCGKKLQTHRRRYPSLIKRIARAHQNRCFVGVGTTRKESFSLRSDAAVLQCVCVCVCVFCSYYYCYYYFYRGEY